MNTNESAGERPMLAHYTLLKILAIFMVMSIHMQDVVTILELGNPTSELLHTAVNTILNTCNGLFFMLSGRFILTSYQGGPGSFYWKRLVKIGLPVLTASIFYYIGAHGWPTDADYGKTFLWDFMQSHIAGYLWFVYALAGFYLAAPFLAVMFRHLGRREHSWLLWVTMAYFLVQNYYQIRQFEMALTSYPFYSWVFYCILGYMLDYLMLTRRQKMGFLLAGGAALAYSCWEQLHPLWINPAIYNYSPTMILLCCAAYLAVTSAFSGLKGAPARAVNFIGRYLFFIYLFHGFTQRLLMDHLPLPRHGYGWWLLFTCCSFTLALLFSIPVYHLAYVPVSRLLLHKRRGAVPPGSPS